MLYSFVKCCAASMDSALCPHILSPFVWDEVNFNETQRIEKFSDYFNTEIYILKYILQQSINSFHIVTYNIDQNQTVSGMTYPDIFWDI